MSTSPAEPMEVEHRSSSDDDERASESEAESEGDAQADLMVVSRTRRANAGNRMSTLLAQTADEEEQWGEEWEEAPNEEEFVGEEANNQDDYNMDSSSSEEEDDGGDDEAGEKELRRVERQERNKKRKAATNPFAARLTAARKRVKLNVPSTDSQSAPVPRPKKKSERASWIPTPEDGPTRMSSRRQTVANKETTMAKLKEKDRKRDDTLAMMKAAEARKAKDEPKPVSQLERLAEAARVERVNSRSLHRWEEAEEQRAAERQAKLDALKNRQIEGPFIRYYSGPAIWVDDKLKFTGKDAPKLEELDEKLNKDIPPASESQNPRSSALDEVQAPQKENNVENNIPSPSQVKAGPSPPQAVPTSQEQPIQNTQAPQNPSVGSHSMPYPSSIMFVPPQNPEPFPFGIEQYTQGNPVDTSQPPSHTSQPQIQSPSKPVLSQQSQTPFSQSPFPNPHELPAQSPFSQPHPSLSDPPFEQGTVDPQNLLNQIQPPPPPPKPPHRKIIRRALRNLLILTSFPQLDDPGPTRSRTVSSMLKEKDRSALIQLSSTLFNWSLADATTFVTSMLNAPKTKKEREAILKGPKKELCAVTNTIARYRDPGTGIPYRDARAFSVIRGVVEGRFVWCGSLGCYVGAKPPPPKGSVGAGGLRPRAGFGVRPVTGVPKRFLEAPKPVVNQAIGEGAPVMTQSGETAATNGPAGAAARTTGNNDSVKRESAVAQ
ncbi:YL1-domain-containing protein [Lojkania enalia]|uniref:YL1-domain-containing protein n=1 Tax=Lojkania enalia TaxID=147567 RepID=A0A9P4NBL3_9PLEO|nr:YL1-domain-containing protein [Didymosphaeria enalia]